ncbi:hypothetical protein OK074_5692 [Actinobacteria bacterium OK074]|nr:hypothetical protein OK074_5692 [Actinobacteria bacterium OK074]
MSVPYETAAYEPAESPESPEEHLARLLGRALNTFELPDETIERLDSALAHACSLYSAHHSSGLYRETHRHTWLLADGSAVTLWELSHNTGPEGLLQHEVYLDEEELRTATARLPLPSDDLDRPDDPDGPDFEMSVLLELSDFPEPRHEYEPDDSADHARRLLRRAENPDRPDTELAALLLDLAFAHEITQAFGRPCRPGGGRPGAYFSLYEHAFLLADGREISLWEVEHTATPDGHHVCEVYETEETAREAIERRAARLGGPTAFGW